MFREDPTTPLGGLAERPVLLSILPAGAVPVSVDLFGDRTAALSIKWFVVQPSDHFLFFYVLGCWFCRRPGRPRSGAPRAVVPVRRVCRDVQPHLARGAPQAGQNGENTKENSTVGVSILYATPSTVRKNRSRG